MALYVRNTVNWNNRNDITLLSEEYLVEFTIYWYIIRKVGDAIKENKKIIILGDFNIHMLPNSKQEIRKFKLLTYFRIHSIKTPSSITEKSSTCLNNIYTSEFIPYESEVQVIMIFRIDDATN